MARKPLPKLYLQELIDAMEDLIPEELWAEFPLHGNTQWRPGRLVMCFVLMGWDDARTLTARFQNARELLGRMSGDWEPPCSYNAYADALVRWMDRILPVIRQRLQQRCRERCFRHWKTGKWIVFAADGSRFECPRTQANEDGLKCAGKDKSAPQVFHTTLVHLQTGALWDFRIGPGTDSERRHLEQMLGGLPRNSLVVADAGFIGWNVCQQFEAAGVHFLLRVGSNITLLAEQLGAKIEQRGKYVWLWPNTKQNQPPLVLRLFVFGSGPNAVYLVTNVLDPKALSPKQAELFYRQRWGIEVTYRTVKQVMDRGQWLSRTPSRVFAEHQATILGFWILQIISFQELVAQEEAPQRWSAATARDIIRRVLRRALDPTYRPHKSFCDELGCAVRDTYQRKCPKRARNWPHKKREKPPGPPRIRRMTKRERTLGKRLLSL